MKKTVRRDGRAWHISLGRCEGSPDPSEVSSLGKLSVFLISYNLITLYDINMDLEMPLIINIILCYSLIW
jgi:hypothetical protein